MISEKLKEILELHLKWTRNEPGGVRANLYGANLYGVNLDGVNLDGVNLDGANLDGASLNRANLDGANLDGANLNRASLDGASLVNVRGWTIIGLLKINWGSVSAKMTLELMRQDVALSPNPQKKNIAMNEWAKGGSWCPFSGRDARTFYFQEQRDLWNPGKPKMTLWKLLLALLKEKEIKHDLDE